MRNHRLRRFAKLFLVSIGVGIVIVCAVAWYVGGRLIANANKPVDLTASVLQFESVNIKSLSGATLACSYANCPGAQATILLFHPLRGNRANMLRRAEFCYGQGFDVMLIDFRAHGASSKGALTFGHLEKLDVASAVDFVTENKPNHKIGVIGWSLGGAAVLLSKDRDIDAIVLESVYPEIAAAVANRVQMRIGSLHHLVCPILIWQMGIRLGISVEDLMPINAFVDFDCPILLLSGTADRHTTRAETRLLFDAASEPKRRVLFQGATHEDLLRFDPDTYRTQVGQFFDAALH